MKVSESTSKDITNYLRLSEVSEEDNKNIELYIKIAKNYIENFTGITQMYKNKKTKFFPSDLAEKRFAREWTKACGRIRGNR